MTFWPLTNSDYPTNQTFHQFHNLDTDFDLHRITSGFHGAFATGVACQQGTLTLPDTWFRPPFWDLLMLQLLRQNSSNLPCLYSTFHQEYPLVLSRFCFTPYQRLWLYNGAPQAPFTTRWGYGGCILDLNPGVLTEGFTFKRKGLFRVKMHSLLLRPGSDTSVSLWCKLRHTIDLSNHRSWFPFWDNCFLWLKFLFLIFLNLHTTFL